MPFFGICGQKTWPAASTLFHEHLSFSREFATKLGTTSFPGARGGGGRGPGGPKPGETYFLEDADLMTDELTAAKKDGVACIVDAGHPDMGRSLPFLKQLSERSGLPIVASTGFYGQPFYTPEVIAMSEDQAARELIRQAQTAPIGAFGEIGTWDVMMSPDEKKVFRAVGKAHLATNLPIFTHTAFGKGAEEQLDTLEAVGVKPGRIAIGHLGGLLDPKVEVQKAICKRGAFVGFVAREAAAMPHRCRLYSLSSKRATPTTCFSRPTFQLRRALSIMAAQGMRRPLRCLAPNCARPE